MVWRLRTPFGNITLVFFNFFTVAHDVLDLGRVHLFGPAAFGVREAAVLEMGLLRVGLMYDGGWKEGRGEFRVGGEASADGRVSRSRGEKHPNLV